MTQKMAHAAPLLSLALRPTDQNLREAVPTAISRRAGILTLIGGALTLSGCGGGGGAGGGGVANEGTSGISPGGADTGAATTTGDTSVAGVSSGGTGSTSTSVGSVTGFGSIIINDNGVRIDDSSATVTDEDGNNLKGKLKLGMQVVSLGIVGSNGLVTSQSIVASGQLLGRIEDLKLANSEFSVLGQKVKVLPSTVYDSALANGFTSLANNVIVEVHGWLDAKHNVLTATFVELKPAAGYFKIIGFVNSLSNTTTNFKIGGLEISTTPSTLPAKDSLVRVRLKTGGNGIKFSDIVWEATKITGIEILGQDRDSFEIQGRLTSYTSATSFSVAGVPVIIPSGVVILNPLNVVLDLASPLAPPDAPILEVKGRLANGVLTASSAKVESEGSLASLEFELHGNISAFAGNGTSGTFTLGAYTVSYNATTTYPTGSGANLANGKPVEVKGTLGIGAASSTLAATRIRFS